MLDLAYSQLQRYSRLDNQILLRSAVVDDVPILALMNQHLIEDEGSTNSMTLPQLEERMRGWIEYGEYSVILISMDNQPVGYIVYLQTDENTLHIRQFFIKRDYRQQGIGKTVIDLIGMNTNLTLDVLETNPSGRLFWEKLGFKPHSTRLHRFIT